MNKRTLYSRNGAWPFYLLAPSLLLAGAMSHSVGVSPILSPFLVLLIWAPFVGREAYRRKRAVEQEKRALQARYDAEDTALFGMPLSSFDLLENE